MAGDPGAGRRVHPGLPVSRALGPGLPGSRHGPAVSHPAVRSHAEARRSPPGLDLPVPGPGPGGHLLLGARHHRRQGAHAHGHGPGGGRPVLCLRSPGLPAGGPGRALGVPARRPRGGRLRRRPGAAAVGMPRLPCVCLELGRPPGRGALDGPVRRVPGQPRPGGAALGLRRLDRGRPGPGAPAQAGPGRPRPAGAAAPGRQRAVAHPAEGPPARAGRGDGPAQL